MNRGSLVQDILDEVSSRIISFQIRLHLLITLVKSSEYFRFIESLRTCIMASQWLTITVSSVFSSDHENYARGTIDNIHSNSYEETLANHFAQRLQLVN